MNGLERIRRALKRQEPDCVPHFEANINPKVREAIKPGLSYEEFIEYMGNDAINISDKVYAQRYTPVDESKRIYRDHWGALVRFTQETAPIPFEFAVKSPADLEKYFPPDPDLDWRYNQLRSAVKRFKGERAIFCGVTDPFDIVKDNLRGDIALFTDMIRNPVLIHQLTKIVLDYQLRYVRNCFELGADFFFINGDYAVTTGPMVSPKMAGEFLMPYLKAIVDVVHKLGTLCIKHSDGLLWSLFDQIVATGIDGIHPIDPEAGMDMGEAKARYGRKVCLMGNIDCGPLLTYGSPEEVRQAVKECIRKGGKGGGLICMSSNSIHSGVKPENYLAMVQVIREYGRYPLEDRFSNLVEAGSGN